MPVWLVKLAENAFTRELHVAEDNRLWVSVTF